MFWKRVGSLVLAALLGLGVAAPVQAQPEIEALVFWQSTSTNHVARACRELGYTLFETVREGPFIEQLQAQSWDFVGIELPSDLITQKETVAQLLEDHVASGGRLLVNFNNLDEWPRLQRLLGLADAEEVLISKNLTKTDPIHPSFPRNHYRSGNVVNTQVWADAGDWLWPTIEGEVAGIFENGEPAIVVSNDGRTLVNGFDWDSYLATSSFVQEQIKYIMSCKADLNPSTGLGVLDLFDYLAFQNLFVQRDPLANMAFDKNFDLFDFLAFQNRFVNGCR